MAKNKTDADKQAAAKGGKNPPSPFYARLLIYRRRRIELGVLCCLVFAVYVFLVTNHSRSHVSWLALVIPVSVIGLIFLLVPATEEWEYTPWQNTARKVEQNFYDL